VFYRQALDCTRAYNKADKDKQKYKVFKAKYSMPHTHKQKLTPNVEQDGRLSREDDG